MGMKVKTYIVNEFTKKVVCLNCAIRNHATDPFSIKADLELEIDKLAEPIDTSVCSNCNRAIGERDGD